jgi:hypothetical protein
LNIILFEFRDTNAFTQTLTQIETQGSRRRKNKK